MNHHKAQFRPGGRRQMLHCLVLLLLSGLSSENTLAGSRQRPGVRTIGGAREPEGGPYLTVIGAPGLRFREPDPEPEPALQPVAAGPPVPGLNVAEAAVAVANAAAVRVPTTGDVILSPVTAPKAEPTPPVPVKPIPSVILPDDMRPRVRAEDFLPFFQIPGTMPTGDANGLPSPRGAPGPAPLPPSSATYTQTPR